MRGILIDPFKRIVTEVDVDGSLASIQKAISAETVTLVQTEDDHDLYLDDEGLLKEAGEQEYFHWRGSSQPFAGKGLILGFDHSNGESSSARIPIAIVAQTITFVENTSVNPEEYYGWTVQSI